MSDYGQRQFKMMLSILDAFDERAIGLGKAIADLDAIYRSLEGTEKLWKGLFYRKWAVLEEVYAVTLNRKLSQLPSADQKLIDDAIQAIRKLVQERINVASEVEK